LRAAQYLRAARLRSDEAVPGAADKA
jgi:hypothetical protein